MTLVLAGDVPTAEVQAEVAKDFGGWSGGEDYIRPAEPARASASKRITVPLNDKPSASVIIGQPTGLRYRDPDALALRVGTAVLGRGFTGRLMGTVRDREGLTYGIGARVGEDSIADGDWAVSASFAPALLERGVESTRRVIAAWWSDGVTDAELSAHKQGLIGSYRVSLSTAGRGSRDDPHFGAARLRSVLAGRLSAGHTRRDARSGQSRDPRAPRSAGDDAGGSGERRGARAAPAAPAAALGGLARRGQLPQHVMQDAAVAVVVELLRRIDAQPSLELRHLAAFTVRDDGDRLGGSALDADDVEYLFARELQDSARSRRP